MRTGSSMRPARHAAVLCAITAVLASPIAAPSPAVAQPECGPDGEPLAEQELWQLRRLTPESVWPLTRGTGVTVAVLDSGVSAAHPVLSGNVVAGADFGDLPDESGRCDEHGHGTAVAGIIAGRDGLGGFHGVAPDATILPGRILPDIEQTRDEDLPDRIGAAITWAVDQGADVVNLSVQWAAEDDAMAEAVAYATEQDVVLVAAAGNVEEDQTPVPMYPAAFDEVIAVAGITADGGHVESSMPAGYVDVAAPGDDVYGPAPGGEGYFLLGAGTSYATAYVSGTAALVRAYYPDLPAEEVARRIIETADRPPEGRNALVGHGVVNPYRAVTTVLGARPDPPAPAIAPPVEEPDPLATARRIAVWAAIGGVALTMLLLLGPPALRRGRQRGWRPVRSL